MGYIFQIFSLRKVLCHLEQCCPLLLDQFFSFLKYCRLKLSSFGRQQVRNIDILCFICGCTNFNGNIKKNMLKLTKLVLYPECFFEKVSKLLLGLIKYVEKILRKCKCCKKQRWVNFTSNSKRRDLCPNAIFSETAHFYTYHGIGIFFFN